MTATHHPPIQVSPGRAVRSLGYGIGALVNLLILWAIHAFWHDVPFLTSDFEQVLPLLSMSLIVSAIVDAAYVAYDAPWFKSLTQVASIGLGLAVVVRLLAVFPFDFTAYDFRWDLVARGALILAIVGTSIGLLVEVGRLLARLARL